VSLPRVGAVGVGAHATASILPSLPVAGLRLAATCARHLERAQDAADRFGAPHAFAGVEEMLDRVELDGVVVVVPPDQFFAVLAACLDRGLPVFAEKPAANDGAEADELAARAERAGVPVVVGYMKRFAAGYLRARELASRPEFGPLTMASFTWTMGGFSNRFSFRDWLFENPVHHFDLARFFCGELDELHVLGSGGREYAGAIVARSQSGALVNIRICTTGSWEQRNEAVELIGDGHAVLVENLDTCIYRPPERPEQVWRPNYTVPVQANTTGETMGFVRELAHFRDVVADGVAPQSDIASAAATLRLTTRIAERVLESAGVNP
jgi:predicted dehydrogenase